MPTTNAQIPPKKEEEESIMPYVVTWAMAIGVFTLLIYVGVWAIKQ